MTKLYYQDESATVFHGDCREWLQVRPEGKFAIISDPVYGMNADFKRVGLRTSTTLESKVYYSRQWEDVEGDDVPFDPSHLLISPIVALFGANHYADKLPASSKWLIWDKRNDSGQDCNSDAELIWTSLKGATRVHYQKWRGIVREGEENLSRSRKLHPMQKPVRLMRWVIQQCKVPVDWTIIDPYMGSGSTLRAARDLGYKTIGCDLSEAYCETTVERLRQMTFGDVELAV